MIKSALSALSTLSALSAGDRHHYQHQINQSALSVFHILSGLSGLPGLPAFSEKIRYSPLSLYICSPKKIERITRMSNLLILAIQKINLIAQAFSSYPIVKSGDADAYQPDPGLARVRQGVLGRG